MTPHIDLSHPRIKDAIDHYVRALTHLKAPALMERLAQRTGIYTYGTHFDPAKRMTPKECFSNALHYAIANELHYVEGLAMRPEMGLLIHHAWCVDPDPEAPGHAIDPTWEDPQSSEYAAIIILPHDEASRRMVKQGYYGLLANDIGYNLDVMREIDPELIEEIEAKRKEAAA